MLMGTELLFLVSGRRKLTMIVFAFDFEFGSVFVFVFVFVSDFEHKPAPPK
jgi:hypothetical protein